MVDAAGLAELAERGFRLIQHAQRLVTQTAHREHLREQATHRANPVGSVEFDKDPERFPEFVRSPS
jgi:hypothetical protein